METQSITIPVAPATTTESNGRPRTSIMQRLWPDVFRNPRPRLLAQAIEVEQSRLCLRKTQAASESRWWPQAEHCLKDAGAALARGDLDAGWALVHQAHRLQVNGYTPTELVSEAIYINEELTSGKFSSWRRRAICGQLQVVMAKPRNGPSSERGDDPTRALDVKRAALIAALQTRDESYSNEYFDLATVRRFQAILIVIALFILVAALVGSVFANPRFEDGVAERWTVVGAALSGALGGITSALQRTTRRSSDRLPKKIGSLVSSLSRPVIGAIAGVSVFLAVRAGITQPTEKQVAYLLLVAFGAGFAERLVVRDPREESAERSTLAAETAARPPLDAARVLSELDTAEDATPNR